MTSRKRLRGKAAALLLSMTFAVAAPVCAGTELWGFVDGHGVAHFASHAVDSRYRLVLGERPTSLPVPGKADAAERLLTWMEIAPEVKSLQPLLREAARVHGLDSELLQAMIAVESAFNAEAVSPRGAVGLMQITAVASERYATEHERRQPVPQRLLDVRTNVHTGARMLADLLRRFGRIDLALAAWNAGEGRVRQHGGMPPIDETRAHVHQVLELYWALLQNRMGSKARTMAVQ